MGRETGFFGNAEHVPVPRWQMIQTPPPDLVLLLAKHLVITLSTQSAPSSPGERLNKQREVRKHLDSCRTTSESSGNSHEIILGHGFIQTFTKTALLETIRSLLLSLEKFLVKNQYEI